jgi:derlin-1
MDPMVLSVLYIWCNLNQDQIVNFWFGTQFPAKYLPWVLLGFNMIISGGLALIPFAMLLCYIVLS